MNICLFGAASSAIDPSYPEAVERLGEAMARRGHGLVFGGGAEGLMGAAARGVARGGGRVLGIAPSFFNVDGVLYDRCTELIFTETMRERKQLMEDHSDAVIMTPGGIGSYDEFFEVLTLKQLGRHNMPIAVFDLDEYFKPMLEMLHEAVRRQFVQEAALGLFGCFSEPEALLDYLEQYCEPPKCLSELKKV
ncbi:MAG: TIGR00730 family Rossman fold protein [Oscillospiraceae bacterium]|nr:TIGR00730 family Rossman fold protein [Oscillospiraceae bacterium]